MKIMIIFLLFIYPIISFAQSCNNAQVGTGIGYLTNSSGQVTSYTAYPIGNVCIPNGMTYTEVANQGALPPLYKAPVVIPAALCTDYDSYIALATSLGLPAQATTAQIQTYVTTLEGDGTNQTNVNQAVKISLEFLALMNDIQQNGGSWSSMTQC